MTDIALACGQPQGFNLQQLDTFHKHEHEVHSDFFVFEECTYKFDGNQALGLFQKKLELFPEKNLFPMGDSYEDEDGAAISWVDKYSRDMIHSSTHTSVSSLSRQNEIWEKEFSLVMQQEELEAFLGVHDDLWNAPSPFHKPQWKIGFHLMPFNHIWIGWKITCHTWSLLAENFCSRAVEGS